MVCLRQGKCCLASGSSMAPPCFFHQPIQCATSNRITPIACEQNWRIATALSEITFNRLCFIWLQWMFTRVAGLEPMDQVPQRFEINVFDPQHSDLAGSQTMAVSKQKDCLVTSVRCESMKQARSLL